MRRLRREVEALGAALADMRAQRSGGGGGGSSGRAAPLRGALAGLVPGASGLLGGGFDRGRLLALYAGRVGGGDPDGPGDPGGSASGDAQRAGLEEWFAALTADLHLNLGTFGDWTFQRGELPTPSPAQAAGAAGNASGRDGAAAGAGARGALRAEAAEAAAKLGAAAAQEGHGAYHAGGAAGLGSGAGFDAGAISGAGAGGEALPQVQDSAAVERRRAAEAGAAGAGDGAAAGVDLEGGAEGADAAGGSAGGGHADEGGAGGASAGAGGEGGAAAGGAAAAEGAAGVGDAEAARHRAARATAAGQAALPVLLDGIRPRAVGAAAGRRERAGGDGLEAGTGAGRGGGGGGGGTDEDDDSMRCRMAAICEGPAACQPGAPCRQPCIVGRGT